jgi:hypothetical protein
MSDTPPESREADASDRTVLLFVLAAVLVLLGTWLIGQQLLKVVHNNVYDLRAFQHLFVRFDLPSGWWSAGVLIASAIIARFVPEAGVETVTEWLGSHRRLVALLVMAVLALLAPVVYQDYPLAIDEFAPWFQAKIFAAGKVYSTYPPDLVSRMLPVPDQFFRFSPITGEAIEANYPTWAAILTPFMLIGLPWLANALAAGVVVLLAGHVADQLLPGRKSAAGWAMLLTIASPVVTVNALSYYTMNLHLLTALGFLALVLQPTPGRLVAAGLVGSVELTLNNPLPHVVMALPWLVCFAWRPNRVRNLACLAVGYLPALLIVPGWMYLQSQVPLAAPVAAAATAAVPEASRSFLRLVQDQLQNGAFGIPKESKELLPFFIIRGMWLSKLYLWAVPGLAFVALLGLWRLRADGNARLIALSFLVTLAAYTFVKVDQGHGWGARYFHPVWGVFPLFGAAWLVLDPNGQRWRRYFLVLAAGSLCVLTPLRMRQVREFIAEARAQTPEHDPSRPQVIFLYVWPGRDRYYSWDAVRNDPFLRGNTIIFAASDPKKDEALLQKLYPGATLASKGTHGSVWNLP